MARSGASLTEAQWKKIAPLLPQPRKHRKGGRPWIENRRVLEGILWKFEFVEREPDQPEEEPGVKEFLRDPSLSGDATEEEIEFLKKLRFKGKRPTPLYYYRELQNLRDPLHFRAA